MGIDWETILGIDENDEYDDNPNAIQEAYDDLVEDFVELEENEEPQKFEEPEKPYQTVGRYYIECPYEEKEEAKALGAKWDKNAKKWYYTNPYDGVKFQKWIKPPKKEEPEEKFYITCHYGDRHKVKKLGAKWDNLSKRWYYTNKEDREKFKEWLDE